jgi:hypothetical protein
MNRAERQAADKKKKASVEGSKTDLRKETIFAC